jgi:hypothetical protein
MYDIFQVENMITSKATDFSSKSDKDRHARRLSQLGSNWLDFATDATAAAPSVTTVEPVGVYLDFAFLTSLEETEDNPWREPRQIEEQEEEETFVEEETMEQLVDDHQ